MTQEADNLSEQINKEYKEREKNRDKSILDEDFGRQEDFFKIIESYVNKVDLANKFIELHPLYYDKAGLWWAWNNKKSCWEMIDKIDILNLIKRASRIGIIQSRQRIEILNALKQTAREKSPKPTKKSWIQFNKEVIDIETGERFIATPEYFFVNPIPHNLGKTNKTPIFDKIFEEWVGKDYVKTLYEIIAYCLIQDYPIQRLFCLIGSGSNGKSCFLRIIKKFVGENNICSTELDTLLISRFEVTRLYKKLVCQMGETNFNEINKTSILKKLTGQDLIGFEYKNKNPFEEINYAKIIIATNSLPITTDKTRGFYKRWAIIDFLNQFSEKKDILSNIPEEEYENLAMKSIEMLVELLKNREFHKEGSIEEREKRYEDRSDPVEKFIKEFTIDEPDNHIFKWEFAKRLEEWCRENKHRIISEVWIGRKMREKGFEDGKVMAEWYDNDKQLQIKRQVRAWIGLKWKEL